MKAMRSFFKVFAVTWFLLGTATSGNPAVMDVMTGFLASPDGHGGYTFQNIGGPGDSFAYAMAINDSGQILVSTAHITPYVYSDGNYSLVSPPGVINVRAWGMNNKEQIVGYGYDGGVTTFIYDLNLNTVSTFAVPGATSIAAYGINNSGTIVGGFGDSSGQHAFILSSGIFTAYDVPDQSDTVFRAINSSGVAIGSIWPQGVEQAFVYDSNLGAETPLIVPGSVSDSALGINDLGQIVGQYEGGDGLTHGFLYNGGTFVNIDYSGGTNTATISTIPMGINSQGDIVGWATYYVVPEPSSLVLLLAANIIIIFGLRTSSGNVLHKVLQKRRWEVGGD